MRSVQYISLALIAISVGLVGCTRPQDEISTVSLVLPHSMSASSGKVVSEAISAQDKLAHVIINITGSGINSPIVYQWDNCHECVTQPPPPSAFEISVPMGSGRLIQVLAIYQNSETSAMNFYYGDNPSVDTNSSQVTATIPIAALPSLDGQQSISGRIAGRYFSDSSTGPTGEVYIRFDPGNGRQKLIIEKSMIYAGWFQFFTLDNVNFEYYMPATGEVLFGGPVNTNSSVFAVSTKVARAGMPKHLRSEDNGTGPQWFSEDADLYVWGWFGNAGGTTGKNVYVNRAGAFSKMKDADGSNLLSVAPSGTIVKDELLNKNNFLATAVKFEGGTVYTNQTFSSSALIVNKDLIDGNGNDNSAGFRAPFVPMTAMHVFTVTDIAGGKKQLTGKVLPGVDAVISKFKAYKKVGVGMNFYVDQLSCSGVSQPNSGWIQADDGAGDVTLGDQDFNVKITMSAGEASSGTAVALCAVSRATGATFEKGAFLEGSNFSAGGGVQYPAATKFRATMAGARSALLDDTCVPMTIDLLDGSNAAAAGSNIVVSLSALNGGLYSSEYCEPTSAITSTSLMNSPSKVIFYKKTTGTSSIAITSSGLLGFISGAATETLAISTSGGSSTATKIVFVDPKYNFANLANIARYECREVYLQLQNSSGDPANWPASTTDTVTSALAGFQLFQDSNCLNTLASVGLSSVNFSGTIQPTQYRTFVKAVTAGPIVPSGNFASAVITWGSPNILVADRVDASQLSMHLAGEIYQGGASKIPAGVCLPVTVNPVAVSGTGTVVATPVAGSNHVVALSAAVTGAGTAAFYSGSDCSVTDNSITFSDTSYEQIRYLKVLAPDASTTVTLSAVDVPTVGTALTVATYPKSGALAVVKLDATLNVFSSADAYMYGATARNWAWANTCLFLRTDFSTGGMSYNLPTSIPGFAFSNNQSQVEYYDQVTSGSCSTANTSGIPAQAGSMGQNFIGIFYARTSPTPLAISFDNNLSAAEFNKSPAAAFSFGLAGNITGPGSYATGATYAFSISTVQMVPPAPTLDASDVGSCSMIVSGWSAITQSPSSLDFTSGMTVNSTFTGGTGSAGSVNFDACTYHDAEIQKAAKGM